MADESPEKSAATVTETAPAATTAAPTTTTVTEPAKVETPADPKSMNSDALKKMIETPAKAPEAEKPAEPAKPEEKPKEEEWFDKDKGFKTKEDALKSYNELQNTLRTRSEAQKKMEEELKAIRAKAETRPLTPEESAREESVKQWESENKEAIDYLEKRIEDRLAKKAARDDFEGEALSERTKWKEEFDKDDSRKVLWPKMEKIYAEKDVFQDFVKNPLKYIEAVAFQQEFPSIAEKVRAEGIEQYKGQVKAAAEAEKKAKTEISGGAKAPTGEIDVTKLKSSEIASLLKREDE